MEELSQFKFEFEFGGVYYFLNKDIIPSKKKYHIYVGSLVLKGGKIEHHFFLINSEERKKYKPHHPIFAGKPPKKYPFLKHNSFVSCKRTFIITPPENSSCIDTMSQPDMQAIVQEYQNVVTANMDIVELITYYLENM